MMLHNESRELAVEAYEKTHDAKRLSEDLAAIRKLIEEQNDFTINEIRDTLHLSASYSTVERAVRAMGFRFKKKTLHASERDRHRYRGKAQGLGGMLQKH